MSDEGIIHKTTLDPAEMLQENQSIVLDWVKKSATLCMRPVQFKKEHHLFELAVVHRACFWFNDMGDCVYLSNGANQVNIYNIYNMINLFQLICKMMNSNFESRKN